MIQIPWIQLCRARFLQLANQQGGVKMFIHKKSWKKQWGGLIGKMKADKTAKSFPIYRILVFLKFDRLDPSYQTSKARIW